MALKLYNTLTKREEEFVPADPKHVTMYTCGPTVYGRPHIGNYSSFLMADLLRRWLEVKGMKIIHVKNITDVGHLVRDADSGEDKIEKQAKEEHGSVSHDSVIAIARKYEEQYIDDESVLNMIEPAHRPRASEYVEQMKEMIETLLKKNHAYTTSDGIYFDVMSFPQYGELSGNTLENLSAGARVEVNEEKKHPADFALWKFCVGVNEHHALRWQSPASAEASSSAKATEDKTAGRPGENNPSSAKATEGRPEGFPGWHIECSAMSRALLGDTIDIHTGGEDNIFPHHECEIAQSECATEHAPFVKMWLHKRRIEIAKEGALRSSTSSERPELIEGRQAQDSDDDVITEKMSKSLGNVLTIPAILGRGYAAADLRYYLLSVHYRTNLKFSWKGMDDAKKARRKIIEWMKEVETLAGTGECDAEQHAALAAHYHAFRDAMDSDLNTAGALAAIFGMMTWSRTAGELCADSLADMQMAIVFMRHAFGCFEPEGDQDIPADVQALLDQRAEARAAKDFAESDRLRDELQSRGFTVKDTADGQKLLKL